MAFIIMKSDLDNIYIESMTSNEDIPIDIVYNMITMSKSSAPKKLWDDGKKQGTFSNLKIYIQNWKKGI